MTADQYEAFLVGVWLAVKIVGAVGLWCFVCAIINRSIS